MQKEKAEEGCSLLSYAYRSRPCDAMYIVVWTEAHRVAGGAQCCVHGGQSTQAQKGVKQVPSSERRAYACGNGAAYTGGRAETRKLAQMLWCTHRR